MSVDINFFWISEMVTQSPNCWFDSRNLLNLVVVCDPLRYSEQFYIWQSNWSWFLFWFLLITEGAPSRLKRNSSFALGNHLFWDSNHFREKTLVWANYCWRVYVHTYCILYAYTIYTWSFSWILTGCSC